MTGYITEIFSRQKDHLFLWFPVFLGLGIGLYFGLRSEPPLWVGPAAGLGLSAAAALGARSRPGALALVCLLGLVALGFSLAQLRAYTIQTPILYKETGPRMIEGIVSQIDMLEPGKGQRVVLDSVVIERMDPAQTPHKIRLRLREGVAVKAGQRIRVLAGLNAPSSPVAPGAFDFQRYLYFKGIGGTGFTFTNPEVIEDKARHTTSIMLEDARQTIAQRTEHAISPAYAPFAVALLTGQQQAVSESDKQALRDSSLAHLLAISGMNIAMIFGSIFFILRLIMAAIPPLALHYPIKKYAAVIGFIGAAVYTGVVGGDVPVMRALLMAAVITLAILIDRSPFSPRLLAFAGFVLLAIAPENLVNVSFQLSFTAVAALIFFFDYTRTFWLNGYAQAGIIRRVLFYLLGIFATTVVAGLATAPIILFQFQNFAVYGVLANMIGVPLMGFIVMPMAILSYFLIPLEVEEPVMKVMEWGISWVMATAHWTAGLDGAVWHSAAWPGSAFIVVICGSIFFLLWQGRERWLGLVAIAAAVVLVTLTRPPDILIAESFKLAGLRGDDGTLHVSSGRAERFTAENWARLNGQGDRKQPVWPREGADKATGLQCGYEGCRVDIDHHQIAFPRTTAAMAEDCAWADVIISPRPLPASCASAVTLDLFDGYRAGAHALWISRHGVKIKTVEENRGHRPWTRYLSDLKNDQKKAPD